MEGLGYHLIIHLIVNKEYIFSSSVPGNHGPCGVNYTPRAQIVVTIRHFPLKAIRSPQRNVPLQVWIRRCTIFPYTRKSGWLAFSVSAQSMKRLSLAKIGQCKYF